MKERGEYVDRDSRQQNADQRFVKRKQGVRRWGIRLRDQVISGKKRIQFREPAAACPGDPRGRACRQYERCNPDMRRADERVTPVRHERPERRWNSKRRPRNRQ